MNAIVSSQELRVSTGATHARFGDGQYLTDLVPETIGARTVGQLSAEQINNGLISGGQASKLLFNDARKLGKLTNFVEIDVTGLSVRQGMNASGTAARNNVQFIIDHNNMNLSGRIVRSGRTF